MKIAMKKKIFCIFKIELSILKKFRIIFWFGKHYETPLLIQSILMNICMFALVQLCVSVNTKVGLVILTMFPLTIAETHRD